MNIDKETPVRSCMIEDGIYLNTVHDAFVSRVIEEYQTEFYKKSNRKTLKF